MLRYTRSGGAFASTASRRHAGVRRDRTGVGTVAKVSRQQHTGHQGEAFVAKLVADAKLIWNPLARDFGIDGQIEMVDDDGLVTGATVLAQVKGREHGFVGQDGCQRFPCESAHIDQWMRQDRPVILILVDVAAQAAWFKRVDVWFRDPVRRAKRVVIFDPVADLLDTASVRILAASATAPGIVMPRVGDGERLVSNLLEVRAFAPFVYSAATPCRRADAWERMRANNAFESGFHITGGTIYSLMPMDDSPLAVLCEGPVSAVPTSQWALSQEPDAQRTFVALLNYTLRAMHHPMLVWHQKKRVVYYQAPATMRKVKVRGRAARSRGRAFFDPHFATDDVNKVRYCRHYAADLRFRNWDGVWFLEINPTYHFTIDGRRDSFWDADYVARVKRLERNFAVLGLVRAWADLLSSSHDDLFARADRRIEFGELAGIDADASIVESLWLPPPAHDEQVSDGDVALVSGLWEDR
jgi:hypothetical protein